VKVIIAGSRYLTGRDARAMVAEAISRSGWSDQISEVVGTQNMIAAVKMLGKPVFHDSLSSGAGLL